jgi:hypothetical protein
MTTLRKGVLQLCLSSNKVGRTTANGATAALVSGVVGPGGNGEGKVVRNGAAWYTVGRLGAPGATGWAR